MQGMLKIAAIVASCCWLSPLAVAQESADDRRRQETPSVLLPGSYWEERDPLKVGDMAPNWTLPLATDSPLAKKGQTAINLERWRGKGDTIVVFWAFWCDTWKDATRYFGDLRPELDKRSTKLVAVAVDASQQPVARPAYAAGKLYFPVAIDGKSQTTARYGVRRVPTIFVISPEGRVRAVWEGLPWKKVLLRSLGR